MSDYIFRKGEAYIGTSTFDNRYKKIFVVTARKGRRVSFSIVNDIVREDTDDCDGTEFVKLRDPDGQTYFLSARVPVDVDAALEIADACRYRRLK